MGKVYLVGAGCGDIGLLTVKGKEILEQADCIVYDRLLNPQLLQYAKKGCECIFVGKSGHQESISQDRIHEILLETAQQYACVVRLKGGDPYVFGRGGEEALFLKAHQIPFEMIPGITSSIGGLGVAGIPVTHRDIARGFRVYTAHTKQGTSSHLNFAELAQSEDTLIFLMGLSSLEEIVSSLLQHGMRSSMPIALTSHLSSPKQQVLVSTLKDILQTDRSIITSPAIIVIGEVVKLQKEVVVPIQLPLREKRYVIMSFEATMSPQGKRLQQLGANVEEAFCGQSVEEVSALHDITLSSYTHLIFSSKRCVTIFVKQYLETGRDLRDLGHITLCCIGKKTAEALYQYGLRADIIPPIYDGEHLVECLKGHLQKQDRVLLIKAKNNRNYLQTALQEVCCIDTRYIYSIQPVDFTFSSTMYDGIVCSCSFHVQCLLQKNIDKQQRIYAIGTPTSQALREQGFKNIIQLAYADKDLLVKTIVEEEAHV